MDVPCHPASLPIILHQSFSARLAEAKKAAIEAALKCRQESLRAADLKIRPVSNTELVLKTESVSASEGVTNAEDTEFVLGIEPVENPSTQVLKHQSIAAPTDSNNDLKSINAAIINSSKTSRAPLKLTKPYSQLKSVRKRQRPKNIKTTFTRFSPSTSKSPMESSPSHPATA